MVGSGPLGTSLVSKLAYVKQKKHGKVQAKGHLTSPRNSEIVEGFGCVILLMGLNVYLTGDGDDGDDDDDDDDDDDRRILRSEVMYISSDVHDKMAPIKLPWMMESIFSANAYLVPRT